MAVWGAGGSGGDSGPTGYDYVQTDQPENPQEGETWYDVDADRAYVYDGANWVEMTVTDHGQLSGVGSGQHRSDGNVRDTVQGIQHPPRVDSNKFRQGDEVESQASNASSGSSNWTYLETWSFNATPLDVCRVSMDMNCDYREDVDYLLFRPDGVLMQRQHQPVDSGGDQTGITLWLDFSNVVGNYEYDLYGRTGSGYTVTADSFTIWENENEGDWNV